MSKSRLSLTPNLDQKIIQAVVGVLFVVLTNLVFYFVFNNDVNTNAETVEQAVTSIEYKVTKL